MASLDPYQPGIDGPWDRRHACHLLRRAGFAPSEAEIQAALSDGMPATVERLTSAAADSSRHDELDLTGEAIAARGSIEKLAAWWLLRMAHTTRPLAARMVLFWHNHFATGNRKVNSPPMMLRQLRTIEEHALGRFDALLRDISRDPAMIVWLDGDANRKGRPNENYARELFELFSLGPGNYSERDIREAARAFSGWHQKNGVFRFNELLHDDGEKLVFDQRGKFGGDQVVDLAIGRPASAGFIARKLLREFVCDDPDDYLVSEFAAIVRKSGFDMAVSLRRLLMSRALFDGNHYRSRIKSPVEFVIGLARSFEMRTPGDALYRATAQMGQRLFDPPTVKGWDGHRRWINSSTMLVRMNTATVAAAGNEGKGLEAHSITAREKLSNKHDAVDYAINVMLDGNAPPSLRAALMDNCPDSGDLALRTAVAAIGSSPEYQLA